MEEGEERRGWGGEGEHPQKAPPGSLVSPGERGTAPPPHLQAGPIVPAGPIVWGRILIGRALVCDCLLSALIGWMRRGLPRALGPRSLCRNFFQHEVTVCPDFSVEAARPARMTLCGTFLGA